MTNQQLSPHPQSAEQGSWNYWSTVIAIGLASTMLPFSVTGAAVALPSMSLALHSSVDAAQWTLNTFNIAFAALPLAAGTLADKVGRRRVLLVSITLVGIAAAVVAGAPAMWVVNTARTVQGCGAAGILASGAAILAHSTSGHRRQVAFGVLGTSFGTGLAIGPLVAGGLTQEFGWRAVFGLVLALAVPALVCARSTPESSNPEHPGLDWPGLVSFTSSLAVLSLAFVSASTRGWASFATLMFFAAGLSLLGYFGWWEYRYGPRAMFDIRLFARASFIAVICQPFTVTLGFVILLVFLPAYLQGVGGHSVAASGLLLLPMTAPVLILPLFAAHLAARTSMRAVLTAASLMIAVGSALLIAVSANGSWMQLAIPLVPFGVGVGLAFGVMDNAAVSTVPITQSGAAAGIFNTMRITGESLAVSAAAAVLTTLTAAQLIRGGVASETAVQLAGRAVQGDLDPTRRWLLTDGFTHAIHIVGGGLAVLSLVGAVLTYVALRPAPETALPRRADDRTTDGTNIGRQHPPVS